MQLTEHVAYELRDRVARITLTRPEARNALSPALAEGLVKAVEEVRRDHKVRAVILSGEGPIFCSGGDLKAFAGDGGFTADAAGAVHEGLLGLHRSPAPVIAAIQGAAIGYGLGLACACDIRLAAQGTRFQAGFTGIGLSPDSTTSYFLPRLFGLSVATRMMLTNLPLEAEEARSLGFASVHPPEALAGAAAELAERIARMPSGALRRAKALLQASLGNEAEPQVSMEVEFIAESFASADFREGVTAFVEKRKPEFDAERQ
jgi:2-(1,2-epoxy-1,2-dihydrophenyl)acetyl-CoA isomerase